MKKINQQFTVRYSFPVLFTRGVFDLQNPAFAQTLGQAQRNNNRVFVVIDSGVFDATPDLMTSIEQYANQHSDLMDFVATPYIMKGGEACKKDASEIDKIYAFIDRQHLCRHSFVLIIGGGAVLDAAGYAAATAHRGIRIIRMPTTTLAQNDAGVGVKTGRNAFGRKNFIGTFAAPFAVINDFDFLKTLPPRTLRAGISEAVKVALIKDREFFDFLFTQRHKLSRFDPDIMEEMITRCAELHIEHIGKNGDPFESGSSRPLDFGHWSAHKIEELTDSKVQHGEAVAIGVALDSIYSHNVGLISEIELHKILVTLEDIGFSLYSWALGLMDIGAALIEFQEHLGGELSIPLLKGIGNKIEAQSIDTDLVRRCVRILKERNKEPEATNEHAKQSNVGKRGLGDILP